MAGIATANDPISGLTAPIPQAPPLTEGIADVGTAKLWYWDTGGKGEAVVLLHPGSGSAEFYPHQQQAFAQAGYRVISYSRRGHYKSDLGTDTGTFIAADDLLKLLAFLKVGRFHAVGNALGGYVGLDVAIAEPNRLASLTLACSMMGIAEPDYQATLKSLRPDPFAALPAEVRELGPSYRAANPKGVAEWRLRHDRSGHGAPVRLRSTTNWRTLAELRVPTLLITGDADLWMPPALLRDVSGKIPGSTVLIVPDAGHGVQWEQPGHFNTAVLDFLRAHPVQ